MASTRAGSSKTNQKRLSPWRFSRSLFDSTRRWTKEGSATFDHDFDYEEGNNDDYEDEDDYEDGIEEENENVYDNAVHFTRTEDLLTINNQRSLHRSDYRPRFTNVLEQQVHDGNYSEEHGSPKDILSKSSPSRMDTVPASHPSIAPIDHPQSTTTFSTRSHPQPILRTAPLNCQYTVTAAPTLRLRPWSQVIWESPVLSESLQQPLHHPTRLWCDRNTPLIARPKSAYPALTKDLFSPWTGLDTEQYVSNIPRKDLDINNANVTTAHSAQYPRMTTQIQESTSTEEHTQEENGSNTLRLLQSIRHDISNNRKTINRLSLGPGFYASVNPIPLSTAMLSTPKTRQQLVRSPARPQSVLIPSSPHFYSSKGFGGSHGQQRHGPALQPVAPESIARYRNQGQLQGRGEDSPRVIPIPWLNLASMSAQDNAKTFHGLGTRLVVPGSILRKEGSQDNALEHEIMVRDKEESGMKESARQHQQYQKQHHHHHQDNQYASRSPSLSRSYHRSLQTPGQKRLQRQEQQEYQQHPSFSSHSSSSPSSTSSSPQKRSSSYVPSRFLPALIESSSSFFFRKPSSPASSSSSSPKYSTKGSAHSTFSRHTAQHSHQQRHLKHSNHNTTAASQIRFSTPIQNNAQNDNNNTQNRTSLGPSYTKTKSASFLPFSLVTYESGGLLGGIRNTSTTICTNTSSDAIALGTPLPPGAIVSTGVPSLSPPSRGSVPAIAVTSTWGSFHSCSGLDSPRSLTSTNSSKATRSSRQSYGSGASGRFTSIPTAIPCTASEALLSSTRRCTRREEGNFDGLMLEKNDCCSIDVDMGKENAGPPSDHDRNSNKKGDLDEYYGEAVLNGSVVIQKRHVAVYEINPRWGPRLIMFLVTVGGILCAVGGGLCAEHHCQRLQLCHDDYRGHGDWCGSSGMEGAPFMLTIGLSMCTFGIYALLYLRSPISRLVGYSEIDQFL